MRPISTLNVPAFTGTEICFRLLHPLIIVKALPGVHFRENKLFIELAFICGLSFNVYIQFPILFDTYRATHSTTKTTVKSYILFLKKKKKLFNALVQAFLIFFLISFYLCFISLSDPFDDDVQHWLRFFVCVILFCYVFFELRRLYMTCLNQTARQLHTAESLNWSLRNVSQCFKAS